MVEVVLVAHMVEVVLDRTVQVVTALYVLSGALADPILVTRLICQTKVLVRLQLELQH
jgi:hypothetical protein